MKYLKYKNLTIWIVVLPLAGIIITTAVFIKVFKDYNNNIYSDNIQKIRLNIIKNNKIQAQNRVQFMESFLLGSKNNLMIKADNEIKTATKVAYDVIDDTYRRYKHLSRWKLISKIQGKLREIRLFDDLKGSYEIYDLNGKALLLPLNRMREQKNMIHLQDAKGVFIIKEQIELVKSKGKFFYNWHKIDERSNKVIEVRSYVYYFPRLNLFIGASRTFPAIQNSIKKQIELLFKEINSEKGNFIFAYDYKGTVLSHFDKRKIGTNIINEQIESEYIVQKMIKGAKNLNEGFFLSYISGYDLTSGIKKYKNSYIKDIKDLKFIIGTGTYYDDILVQIKSENKKFYEEFQLVLSYVYTGAILVLLLILIITFFISIRINKSMKEYEKKILLSQKEISAQSETLKYQVEHDNLTGLLSRRCFFDKLSESIKSASIKKNRIAVIFIDIDKFKNINDKLGHDAGDIIIKNVADNLKLIMRNEDTVSRFGGDEFVMYLENIKDMKNVLIVLQKIENSFKTPIAFNETEIPITLSMGISVFPDDTKNIDVLMKNADIAMYRAKSSGRNQYKFFSSTD